MNLKTRIRKLENSTLADAGKCRCLPEFIIITDNSKRSEANGICQTCGLKTETIEATFQIGTRAINEH